MKYKPVPWVLQTENQKALQESDHRFKLEGKRLWEKIMVSGHDVVQRKVPPKLKPSQLPYNKPKAKLVRKNPFVEEKEEPSIVSTKKRFCCKLITQCQNV